MQTLLEPQSLQKWWLWGGNQSDHLKTTRPLGTPMTAMRHDFPHQKADGTEETPTALISDRDPA